MIDHALTVGALINHILNIFQLRSYFNASTDLAISSKLPTSPFSDGYFL
jgi:hypothetical protein